MSQRWLNLVRDAGPDHPATCALVRALADYANDYGVAWPSIATLANYMRTTERTVNRRLSYAKADGWVTVRPGGGRHRSNVYTLVPERFSRLVPAPFSTGSGNPDRNPDRNGDRNPDEGVTVSRETLTLSSRNPDALVTQPPRPPKSSSPAADPLPGVLVGVTDADDDWDRTALAGLAGVGPTTTIRRRLAAARSAGWTATNLNRHLAAALGPNVARPMAVVTTTLDGLPPAPTPAPAWPDWCGSCDRATRLVDMDDAVAKCPACHPTAAAATPADDAGAPPAVNGHRKGASKNGTRREPRTFDAGWVERFKAATS